MYTAIVGKTFLDEYNRRNGTALSAKAFFDGPFFDLQFNHDKFMFYMNNSTFDQLVKQKVAHLPDRRVVALQTLHTRIEKGEIDGSTAVGFPASTSKEFGPTSGLVSDIRISYSTDDYYYSWLGGALCIGVSGGYSLLFNDPNITYATFEGWAHYRRFLNDSVLDGIPSYKLTSWNGQWLAYYFGPDFQDDFNFSTLVREGIFETGKEGLSISIPSWSKVYFSMAQSQAANTIIAYVASLGSVNRTVGFIPFHFKSGRNLIAIYQNLFGESEYRLRRSSEFEAFFGRNIRRVCEMGSVGMHALRPESLEKYFADGKNLKFVSAETAEKTENESDTAGKTRNPHQTVIITYQTYKTWIVAMLSKNKTDISDYSRDIAQALVQYRAGGRKLDRKNILEKEFFKTSKTEMLKALEKIVADDTVETAIVDKMNSLRDQIHFLSKEDFTYFVLLLKFDYAFAEHQFNNQ